MEINTKYFGKLPFEQEEAIIFENGIFGFEDYKKYILIRFDDDKGSLLSLQSIDNENLAFVAVNPFKFIPDYAPILTEEDLKDLRANSVENLLVYNICVIKDNLGESTINLRCPIIVNAEIRLAKQVILEDSNYSFRLPFNDIMNNNVTNKEEE